MLTNGLKIYFAGSIRAGREDVPIYEEIIKHLKTYGEVLTEHVGDRTLSILGDEAPDDRFIHDRDMDFLRQCEVVIAEVTMPSTGVGYEIAMAINMKKRVLCLYRTSAKGKLLSAMIAGCPDIMNKNYQAINEAKSIIDDFIARQTV